MKIKQNCLKVGLVLTALTLLALAYSAMAGDQVPYKGEEVGVVTKGAFQFPFSHASTAAEGEATYIGHYTLTGDFTVDVRFGTAAGVFTLTAANGDMLFTTTTGHALQPLSLKETVDTVTVTGYAAKVAQFRGDARSVVTADGRSLFGGASDDGRPDAGLGQ